MTREVYNRIAEEFSRSRRGPRRDLLPLLQYVKTGDRVLDVGCGSGRLYGALSEKKISYIGIDQSEKMIEIARKEHPDAEFLVGDMTAIPFPDAEFDAVFCVAAFHHLSSESARKKTLLEMKRVLKPSGKIILTNWNLRSAWAKKKYGEGKNGDWMIPWKESDGETIGVRYYHGFTTDELEKLFFDTGLRVEAQYYALRGVPSNADEGDNLVSILTVP